MDFGIFGVDPNPEQVQQIRNFLAANLTPVDGQGQRNTNSQWNLHTNPSAGGNEQQNVNSGAGGNEQQNGNAGAAGNGSNQTEPVLMHNILHRGIVCDNCDTEIRGFRYKCMQCPDFDLCSRCEHKGHHAGHVMMRISFPEQAQDAIRKYLNNGNGSCPPSPPHHRGPHHHSPFAGYGPGRTFEEMMSQRRGHCQRRASAGHGHGHTGNGGDADRPGTGIGCPYTMGRKELKKWSKWMKKASTHQNRSAEAYARAAAASGASTRPGAAAGSAEDTEGPPMDFAAVASQIQEFLNYWGIPVDVVELYDQFGNRGQPQPTEGDEQRQSPEHPGSATATPNQNNPGTQENQEDVVISESINQQPGSPAAANLTENMQQMQINEPQNNASAVGDASLLMDLDNENSGWTILDNSREQSPGNADTQQPEVTTAAPEVQSGNTGNQASPAGSMGSNNGNTSTPFASAGSSTTSGSGQSQPATTPSAPPSSFPTGVPNVPLYPVLNTPQIQQILQGVSSAVNSVVRSIPIVTDPRGPMGTNVTTSTTTTTTRVPAPSTGATGQAATGNVELDARSMKTLNQLLAMGFSNEGGYLTRLVLAKNGDLEAVLSSLFPN